MTEPLDLAAIRENFTRVYPGVGILGCSASQGIALCDELDRLRLRETTLQFTLDTERGENERLRAELAEEQRANAIACEQANLQGREVFALHPIDEAARALDALWKRGHMTEQRAARISEAEHNLAHAVAAYEAQQGREAMSARYCAQCGYVPVTCSHLDGSQPSPSVADVEPQIGDVAAAGDQREAFWQAGIAAGRKAESLWLTPQIAERDATIARLERDKAALHKGNISLNLDIVHLRAELNAAADDTEKALGINWIGTDQRASERRADARGILLDARDRARRAAATEGGV